jgi:DNA-binding response OmpR family regulator
MSAILLVENDLAARRALADLLTASGHEVVPVAKPAEALQHLRRADLLILDMDGPRESILADLDRIRAARADLPVVATASATWHGWRALSTAMRLGSDDLLTKPFDEEEVSRIVRSALAKGSPATADTAA